MKIIDKNRANKLVISAMAAFMAVSCGTSAYFSNNSFENGIYYTPAKPSAAQVAKERAELAELQNETKKTISKYYLVKTESSEDNVSEQNATIIPLADGETYEERLTKFDSPQYTVNLNITYDPWYDWYAFPYYGWSYWSRPYWCRYGFSWNYWHHWHHFGWYDPWYDPWYGPWDPWYGPYYSWYNPWFDPWYGPYYGWYNPWHHGGYWPAYGPNAGRGRDIYYGSRNNVAGSSYSPVAGNRNSGSSYRRVSSGADTKSGYNQVRGYGELSIPRNSSGISNSSATNTYRRTSSGTTGYNKGNAVSTGNTSVSTYRKPVNSNSVSTQSYYRTNRNENSNVRTEFRTNTNSQNSSSQYRRTNSSTYNRSSFNNSSSNSIQRSNSGTTNSGRSTYRRR